MWIETKVHIHLAIFFVILVAVLLFHQSQTFPGSAIGHGIGILGSLFMLMTLVYPFRKRVLKKKDDPIIHHVSVGLLGPSLVIIHSGHKVSSLIGLLLFITVVTMVLSGIVGYYLYKRVNRSLRTLKREQSLLDKRIKNRKSELISACKIDVAEESPSSSFLSLPVLSETNRECSRWIEQIKSYVERDQAIILFDKLKSIFSYWIRVHYTITALLFALMFVHIISTLYYGLRWLP